jgi:hypothetical protein
MPRPSTAVVVPRKRLNVIAAFSTEIPEQDERTPTEITVEFPPTEGSFAPVYLTSNCEL